jgi:hypothetical protein
MSIFRPNQGRADFDGCATAFYLQVFETFNCGLEFSGHTFDRPEGLRPALK